MKGRIASWLLLILLSTSPYLNTLSGAFVYDDSEMVLENRNVTGKATLYQLFFDKHVMTFSGEIYRPLRDISYRIDYLIGGKEPFIYHVSNIFLHALATIVVYLFLALLLKDYKASFFAAAIFAVHPLHTESVAWIKGRDDMLFAIFYLSSFAMYLKYEEGRAKGFYYSASITLFILSLFSKEMAVTLPLAIVMYQVFFKRIRLHPLVPFFVTAAMYLMLRTHVLAQVAQMEGYWGGSLFATMLTMIKGIAQYLRLAFLPINQCADYLFPVSTSVDFGVLLSLFCLAISFVSLFLFTDKRILWGALFFFVSLLPVLNIVPIKAVIAERFIYLPLLGFCIVFASAICRMFSAESNLRIVGGIIVGLFFILTIQRSYVWSNEYSLWTDTVRKSPGNSRAHYNLGTEYASKDMLDKAIAEFRESIRLSPDYPDAFNALGLAYYKKGMVEGAGLLYRDALRIDTKHRDARYNLALLYHEQGRVDDAIKEYGELLRHKADDFDALNGLGLAYFQKGFFEDALLNYNRALKIDPESASPYNNIGMLYAIRGDEGEAEKWFKKAIEVDPKSAEAYYNLGFMYQNLGRLNEAARFYEKAIEIRPDYKEAKERLMSIEKGIY